MLDAGLEPTLDADELERRRIEARVPRWGREIDERMLPAEAGLDATHVSFSKGCYPGQEPVARLHYRGHPNRGLRVLELADVPAYDAELVHDGKAVGRVTSAARRADGSVVALAYVRAEVPDDARARACPLEPAAWWAVRRAQNRKPATYRCPLCGYRLHAMSPHVLISPEGDTSRRRHAHAECVAARAADDL